MKILFVTENLPYPLDRGGYIRSAYIIRELCRQHEVTLLTMAEDVGSDQGKDFYKQICQKVIYLPKPKLSMAKKSFYLLDGLLKERPYPLNKNFSVSFFKRIEGELEDESYQVLHCDHLDTAQYLPLLSNPAKAVFDTHNLLFILVKRLCEQEKSLAKRVYLNNQIEKIKVYEKRLSADFDLNLVCSEKDKDILKKLSPSSNVEVIPNGVDLNYYQTGHKSFPGLTLIFVGRLDYLPNSQGVLYFYNNVWPLVKKEVPQARWQIIGGSPPAAVNELANDRSIKIVEQADDMRPYLAKSTISIVPLQIGGGTRLKILEAMATGLPVVSTSVGAEGIDAVDGQEIIIADEPQIMAQRIVDLLQNPAHCNEIAQKARNFVEKFDWQVIGKKLLLCYNSIIESG